MLELRVCQNGAGWVGEVWRGGRREYASPALADHGRAWMYASQWARYHAELPSQDWGVPRRVTEGEPTDRELALRAWLLAHPGPHRADALAAALRCPEGVLRATGTGEMGWFVIAGGLVSLTPAGEGVGDG